MDVTSKAMSITAHQLAECLTYISNIADVHRMMFVWSDKQDYSLIQLYTSKRSNSHIQKYSKQCGNRNVLKHHSEEHGGTCNRYDNE